MKYLKKPLTKKLYLKNNNFKQATLKGHTITNLQPKTTYTHQSGSNINFVDTTTIEPTIGQKIFYKNI